MMTHKNIYFSNLINFNELSIGFYIGTEKCAVYGTKGRIYFAELHILFIHLCVRIVKRGF